MSVTAGSAKRNAALDSVLNDARQRFIDRNPKSLARHIDAKQSLPGGNTRAILWYAPFPLTLVSGNGCYVTDLDGHQYVDLLSEYTAGLYGHSDPTIADAMIAAIKDGVMLGAPNRYEAQLGAAIVERFPAIERVRFCNSGTEANIMALTAARAITGRTNILVFRESYHGGVLTFGNGGSPLNLPFPYLLADYNDEAGVERIMREHANDLAAIILEPMLGAGGCIVAKPTFLPRIRELADQLGVILIFDEVQTSRLGYRALHGELGILPDMVTLGKYLGGGASFGAFGGKASIMERFDPARPNAFSHSGTFNNNVMSMAAGLAGFTKVLTEEASRKVNAIGDWLRSEMNAALEHHSVAATVLGKGSLMNLHFVDGIVETPTQLKERDVRWLELWHVEMVLRGFYVAPRGLVALSLPFDQSEAKSFMAAFDDFLASHRSILPTRFS
ncbi:aspartate aminotransferase family protein [Sinorhizobium meliloti]|uniref:aspartate aminotransferase family protein n=1 Tax=Rhizobium meliloti TaxID=382 RepID=UPI000B49BEA5|nr:aminotransferase class III-fold pyridoxal phosphate-dependent enzyme [Sinorhizobium meliloti]ASP69735.1 aspartate aminotransferase family protein [Sinorhizobium meliloti]MQX01275.1 aminotransferase class III-fold pyridoxal phosphate-dependent enzyme [Sinorhizobium meliloti]RVK37857.1 aminotransferase class III-fold pyridoxal phosphate-dependent enzyme [Sinorhizobium meliloti]